MLEEIKLVSGTWPGSRSLSESPDVLHQILKAREALVSAVGQNSLDIHEKTRKSGLEGQREESLLGRTHTVIC